jgi:hypothetical protein
MGVGIPYYNVILYRDGSFENKNMSRFTGRAHEHEVKLIVLMMMLSWMWDLPTDLYPGAPP